MRPMLSLYWHITFHIPDQNFWYYPLNYYPGISQWKLVHAQKVPHYYPSGSNGRFMFVVCVW